jgi:hypothetical protein
MSKTKDGPTAEATARYISEHAWTRDVISRGCVVLEMGDRKKDALDWKVAHLMADLFYAARCGWAGAEYNLEKAGMIEMLSCACSAPDILRGPPNRALRMPRGPASRPGSRAGR